MERNRTVSGRKGPYRVRYASFFIGLVGWLAALTAAADHTTYVLRIPGSDRAVLERVEAVGGVVDRVDGHYARVYVHVTAWEAFQALGLPYTVLEIQPRPDKQRDAYPSYNAITEILNNAAANYPEIVRVESLGQSVQGREIWALRITDQPDANENEPEFAYISTMHGDEPVGTVLCLNFLDELLAGYGVEPLITAYINETEIWLIPLMNPDGYELGMRFNANNRDLNRSFPAFPDDFTGTMFTEGPMDTAGRQPEVAHIMNWTAANSLTLCANFHTGALLVNYPYDNIPGVPSGSDAPTPDDALMRDLAAAYASRNPPMFDSPIFPGGISNGSAWFSITGGMQDWHYRFAGAIDMTIELSDIKAPAASTLPDFWDDNRDAMYAFLERVHRGVQGLVTDQATGAPLYARVLVDDNPQPVFTDPDAGDYHRLLLPGTYTVRAEAPGYIPRKMPGVTVSAEGAVRADLALSRGDVDGNGLIDAADLQLVINAVLELNTLAEADVDGGGVTATDVQHLVNRVLHR